MSDHPDPSRGALRRVDPRVLDDDPFWSQVRQRHPDVDIVLLPDSAPEPTATDPEGLEQARVAALRLTEAWRTCAPVLADRGVNAPPSVRTALRVVGPVLLLKKAVPGLGVAGATQLLRDLAAALGGQGWEFAPGSRGGQPLLRATDGIVRLEAQAGSSAAVVTLAVSLVGLARADQDLLRERVLGEVASWA